MGQHRSHAVSLSQLAEQAEQAGWIPVRYELINERLQLKEFWLLASCTNRLPAVADQVGMVWSTGGVQRKRKLQTSDKSPLSGAGKHPHFQVTACL